MARKEKKKAGRGEKQGKGAQQTERDVAEQQLSGPKSFLYVGGRDCQVAHLRQIASNFGAELIHHDGGLREAVSRIDPASLDQLLHPTIDPNAERTVIATVRPSRVSRPMCTSAMPPRPISSPTS